MIEAIALRKCGSPQSARTGPRRRNLQASAPAEIFGPSATPLFRLDRGLGEGLPAASGITAAGGSIAASLIAAKVFGAAAATGPLAPFVLAGAAIAAIFLKFFGGGCGEACTNAAKVEQIYEAAALNVEEVGKLGMISRGEAITGMQMFTQAGQQHEAQFADQHAADGSANLTKVIGDIIARSQSLPAEATKPLNLDEARGAYVHTGSYGKDWYPDSLTAAGQLSDQYLSGLAASPTRQVSQAAGQVESALRSAGIPPWAALAAAGVAIIWWSNR